MPLLLVATLPMLHEPPEKSAQVDVTLAVVAVVPVAGPVARPEATVNGEPLSQIHRLPTSHPPISVLAHFGMLPANMWPLPSGKVYCEVMVKACGISKLERPRSIGALKLSSGAAKPLPSPPVEADRTLSMLLLQV